MEWNALGFYLQYSVDLGDVKQMDNNLMDGKRQQIVVVKDTILKEHCWIVLAGIVSPEVYVYDM